MFKLIIIFTCEDANVHILLSLIPFQVLFIWGYDQHSQSDDFVWKTYVVSSAVVYTAVEPLSHLSPLFCSVEDSS